MSVRPKWTSLRRSVLATAWLAAGLTASAASPVDKTDEEFRRLDADHNGVLSREEYSGTGKDRAVRERDFLLFNSNRDEHLSLIEFAAVPGLAPTELRGPLPDPFDVLLDQATAALDEAYNQWDRRATATIETRTFVTSFSASISPDGVARLSSAAMTAADPNRDGQVTRDEARTFLEMQLGIRSPTGEPLRDANGRVINWKRFQWLDGDHDGAVSRDEFLPKGGANALQLFEAGDGDHDQRLTWDEYCDPAWATGREDPVEWFRRADKDLDALLSAQELLAATSTYRQHLCEAMLPAFDDDSDGKLSLTEYRICPLGNWICAWDSLRFDADRDDAITFPEFQNEPESFLLLQRLYFSRLDLDGDGRLVKDELPFRENPPNAIYRMGADGSELTKIWQDSTHPNGGSPEISPDGKTIAFDFYPDGKIFLLDADGKNLRELCDGLMPSWSADGKSIAYSQGSSIGIIGADGQGARIIAQGWGAQWSPDGKYIAYTQNGGLWRYDVVTAQSHEVLPRAAHPYLMLYYGMSWSPDSRRVAIKGAKQSGSDVVSVDLVGPRPDLKVLFSTDQSLSHDMNWSPDGKRLLISLYSPEHKHTLLQQLDLEHGGDPTPVSGLDPKLTLLCSNYSRGGEWLVLTAK